MSHSPPQFSDEHYRAFQSLIMAVSGLNFPPHKRVSLENTLRQAMKSAPLQPPRTFASYYNLLNGKGVKSQLEMRRLLNLLTVGETHFFRDAKQFEALTSVLQELIARKRAEAQRQNQRPQLRLWSAGCASGEEPYSLAMLLHQLLPDLDRWQLFILGTDMNTLALNRAKEARYSSWSFREAQALEMQDRYFEPHAEGFALKDHIREMVRFTEHNLMEPFPAFQKNIMLMDVILCRNVMIYFAPHILPPLLEKFEATLNPGGWLVVGQAETWLNSRHFTLHTVRNVLLYQKPDPDTPPPPSESLPPPSPPEEKTEKTEEKTEPTFAAKQNSTPPAPKNDNLLALLSEIPALNPDFNTLLQQGQLRQAETYLQEQLQTAPPDVQAAAHTGLAKAYADVGQLENAKQHCQRAIKLYTLLPEAHFVLALILQNQGQVKSAIEELKTTLYLNRNLPLAHLHLALLRKQQGQPGQAKLALKNVIRILNRWPKAKIIPDSNGTSTKQLLDTAERMLETLG